MILPRVKGYKKAEGKFIFKDKEIIQIIGNNTEYLKSMINVFNNEEFTMGREIIVIGENGNILAEQTKSEKKEYYEIFIFKTKINIKYTDSLSLRNAIATIISLVVYDETKLFIDCAEIRDYPDFEYRSFLIDLARKYVPMENAKRYIKALAIGKYNKVHFHLSDVAGFAYYSDIYPELNNNLFRKLYKLSELKELVDYAENLGLLCIPEIDLPAHSEFLNNRIEGISCKVKGDRISKYVLCISNEKTYEIIENLLKELCGIFKGQYLHLGGDELSFADLTYVDYWPEWERCPNCKKMSEKYHLKCNSDRYVMFANRVDGIVKKLGRKMIIWNDNVDISKLTNLNKDIIIQFWRIAMSVRGPNKGCSMQKFLEQGFNIINSFFEDTYVDNFLCSDRLSDWNPCNRPEHEEKYNRNIIGGEFCSWGTMHHYDFTLIPNIYYCADRLWNKDKISDDEELSLALVRQTISHRKEIYNIFKVLGNNIFILNDYNWFDYNSICKDPNVYDKIIEQYKSLIIGGYCDCTPLNGYIYVLISARAMLRNELKLPYVDLTETAYE